MLQWITALEKSASSSIYTGKNRFDSFAPIHLNVAAQWLVDGVSYTLFKWFEQCQLRSQRDYFWNLSRAILLAKDVIYIHDWWLSPGQVFCTGDTLVIDLWFRVAFTKAREGKISARPPSRKESQGRRQNLCHSLVCYLPDLLLSKPHFFQVRRFLIERPRPTAGLCKFGDWLQHFWFI